MHEGQNCSRFRCRPSSTESTFYRMYFTRNDCHDCASSKVDIDWYYHGWSCPLRTISIWRNTEREKKMQRIDQLKKFISEHRDEIGPDDSDIDHFMNLLTVILLSKLASEEQWQSALATMTDVLKDTVAGKPV